MLEQPKIYVSAVPDNETTRIPADAVDLTSGAMGYMVNDNIDGLARPDADFSISALAGANASRIGGRQITERNIVMDIIPLPDFRINRERLYHILPFGETRRFYIETKDRFVFIDGEIEKLNGAFKPDKPFSFDVSIICPFPWVQSVKLHKMKLSVGENKISYDGDIPAGFTLNVPFKLNTILPGMPGNQTDVPIIKIENGYVTDLSVSIGERTFSYSGKISRPYICTIPGKKKFTGRMYKASEANEDITTVPAFGAMKKHSQWPTIDINSKTITISCADDGFSAGWFNKQNVFAYRDTYSGV